MTTCTGCGDTDLVVNVNGTKQTTYCQSCGREEEETVAARGSAPVISLTRAAILKKINSKPQEQQAKKPKQLRDRTDYTKARRAR